MVIASSNEMVEQKEDEISTLKNCLIEMEGNVMELE